jgi:hypothetical protein
MSGSPPPSPERASGEIGYTITETALGEWRRYDYPDGTHYSDYRSYAAIGPVPLVHLTYGLNPETGRRVTARGVVAIGRFACGGIALGQVAWGLIAVGQLAVGVCFGCGQAATGVVCLGQLALGVLFGAGQLATGQVAIGQIAFGEWVLAQIGFGTHVYDTRQQDPAVLDNLRQLLD